MNHSARPVLCRSILLKSDLVTDARDSVVRRLKLNTRARVFQLPRLHLDYECSTLRASRYERVGKIAQVLSLPAKVHSAEVLQLPECSELTDSRTVQGPAPAVFLDSILCHAPDASQGHFIRHCGRGKTLPMSDSASLSICHVNSNFQDCTFQEQVPQQQVQVHL